jgi:hypothetical protein
MLSKKLIYYSQGIDGNNMGYVHSNRNVYQSQCPNIGDYDIVFGITQMFAYCDVDWVGNMAVTINPHHVMFSYWEMVLSVGIIINKPLLLRHQ